MSTSALSPVIDYLLAQFTTVVTNVDANGVCVESWVVDVPPAPAPILVVGCVQPDDSLESDESRMYLALGSGGVEEDFQIHCYIDVSAGGADQGVPRKIACQVFDGVVDAIRADLTLGGLLHKGRFAELTNIVLYGTRFPEEAAVGRRSVLSFTVRARNFY